MKHLLQWQLVSTIGMKNPIAATLHKFTSAPVLTHIKVYAWYLSFNLCLSIWVINPNWTSEPNCLRCSEHPQKSYHSISPLVVTQCPSQHEIILVRNSQEHLFTVALLNTVIHCIVFFWHPESLTLNSRLMANLTLVSNQLFLGTYIITSSSQ